MKGARHLNPPRSLTEKERAVLEYLLGVPFPGAIELRRQLASANVSGEYPPGDPTIVLSVDRSLPPARVRHRIPIEAEGTDADGARFHVLLHVVNGFMDEVEFYREDGQPILALPDPRSLQLHCLDDP